MLNKEFSESWFNGRHRLMGRELLPLCLWHYAYLQLIDSPLIPQIKKTPDPEWADLEQAARICTMKPFESIHSKVSLFDKARMFLCMARYTFEKEKEKWNAYYNDYFSAPKFNQWKSQRSTNPRGAPPDVLAVAASCMMIFGGQEQRVWGMPIGKAYWYSSMFHYNSGTALDFMTAKDEAMRMKLRLMRARGEI